jgi:UDP-N-acetylmuramoylalanine-D-glutamate ligase
MEKLDDVIDSIRNNSREISAVLFSPASASFDQYANYKDRGEAFNDLVGAQNG